MRSLIRPALFGAVRFWLFFSITAWLATQCLHIFVSIGDLELEFHVREWGVVYFEPGTYAPEVAVSVEKTDSRLLRISPPVSFRVSRNAVRLSVHHWLIVSTFILCYAVLKFIFRSKPEAKPCDD